MWMLFSVQDVRASEYGAHLICARNEQVAARMFADAVLGPGESLLRLHPEDFRLCLIGYFNEETAELSPELVSVVITAEQIVRRQSDVSNGKLSGDPAQLEVSLAR